MQKCQKERKEDKQKEKERLQIREALFGEKPKPARSITQEMSKGNAPVPVKGEREHEAQTATFKKAKAWSRSLAGSSVRIDLDDSGEETEKGNPPADRERASWRRIIWSSRTCSVSATVWSKARTEARVAIS